MRVLLVVSCLLVLALIGCATPSTYESKPIEAWVVDAGTGQPIEGAIVLAHWDMHARRFLDEGTRYSIKTVETVTDSKGHFSLEGWGPQSVCCGVMDENNPQVIILKPGYSITTENDMDPSLEIKNPPVRQAYWNKETFRLIPYKYQEGDFGKQEFDGFERHSDDLALGFLMQPENPCDWEKFPDFMAALEQQVLLFKQHGYEDKSSIIQDLTLYPKCKG